MESRRALLDDDQRRDAEMIGRIVKAIASSRPIRDWNEFWFRTQCLSALGLFRIAVGLCVLHKLHLLILTIDDFYSTRGTMSLELSRRTVFEPRICIFDYFPPNGAPTIFALAVALALLVTVGCATRPAMVLLYIFLVSIDNRNIWVFNSGDRNRSASGRRGSQGNPLGGAGAVRRNCQG